MELQHFVEGKSKKKKSYLAFSEWASPIKYYLCQQFTKINT